MFRNLDLLLTIVACCSCRKSRKAQDTVGSKWCKFDPLICDPQPQPISTGIPGKKRKSGELGLTEASSPCGLPWQSLVYISLMVERSCTPLSQTYHLSTCYYTVDSKDASQQLSINMPASVVEDPKPDTVQVEVQNNDKDVEGQESSTRIMIHAQQQARIRRKVGSICSFKVVLLHN